MNAVSEKEGVKFLLAWLGVTVERAGRFAVRPTRNVVIDLPLAQAFDRCVTGLEEVVGAMIQVSDRERGYLEATFGLTFSERIACTLVAKGSSTLATLESRRNAGTELPKDVSVLDRLERWLREGA